MRRDAVLEWLCTMLLLWLLELSWGVGTVKAELVVLKGLGAGWCRWCAQGLRRQGEGE